MIWLIGLICSFRGKCHKLEKNTKRTWLRLYSRSWVWWILKIWMIICQWCKTRPTDCTYTSILQENRNGQCSFIYAMESRQWFASCARCKTTSYGINLLMKATWNCRFRQIIATWSIWSSEPSVNGSGREIFCFWDISAKWHRPTTSSTAPSKTRTSFPLYLSSGEFWGTALPNWSLREIINAESWWKSIFSMEDCCLRKEGRNWCSNFWENSSGCKVLSVVSKDSTSVHMIWIGRFVFRASRHSLPNISRRIRCLLQICSIRPCSHCKFKTTMMNFTRSKMIRNSLGFQFLK